MKTSVKILIVALSVFHFTRISAQEFYDSYLPLTTKSNTLNYKLTGNTYTFHSSLNGTVYLKDQWSKGSLKLENGDIYENISMKLNTLIDELIIFNSNTGVIFNVDKSIVSEFDMGLENNRFNLFRKVCMDEESEGCQYFNVLYDNKIKLYLRHKTVEVETSVYKDDSGIMRNSEFTSKNEYFIVFPDNSFLKVSPKRRSFLQLFPEQKSLLRKAFRKEKIHFYNETEDIVNATKLVEQELF